MGKSLHIQCKLHEDIDYEAEAVAYYLEQIEAGHTPRQIITDALLRAAGFSPEMYSQKSAGGGRLTVASLEQLLADFAQEIKQSLKGHSLRPQEGNNEQGDNSESDEIEDEEFARNIAASYIARRNRRGG